MLDFELTDQQKAAAIMSEVGAVITGSHIVYTSGKHGSAYVNKDAVYPYLKKTSRLCRMIAREFTDDRVGVVVAPAVGGVILSQWVAYNLPGQEVLSVYADKVVTDGEHGFIIKRGYDKLIAGKKVLVVEDVLTTGDSVRKTIAEVRRCEGTIAGVGVLCNRGGLTAESLDVPRLVSLMEVTLDMWDEADCPLCKANIPINTEVGKGREFLARKQV